MNLFGNEGDKTMELSFDDEDNKDGNENFVHKLEKGIVKKDPIIPQSRFCL